MVAVLEIVYPNADKVRLDLEQEMRRGGLFACAAGAHELEPFAPIELRLVVGDHSFCAATRLTTASPEFMCVEIPAQVTEQVEKWLPQVGTAESAQIAAKVARLIADTTTIPPAAVAETEPVAPVEVATAPEAETNLEVTEEAILEETLDEPPTAEASETETNEAAGRPITLDRKIAMLSVGEKVQMALHSGREERAYLIKERVGVVQASLIRNVKISIDEVVALARAPHLAADAAEVMVQHRVFGHSPQVALALVRNPRTPTPLAVEMIERLSHNDLRVIAKGNGVRANIAQAARKRLLTI